MPSAIEAPGVALVRGDSGGNRYSTLTDIDRANVKNLKLAWEWKRSWGRCSRNAAQREHQIVLDEYGI
jgi:glucose dehydrogenase